MIYEDVLKGRFVDLRSITLDEADVEFSYQIRKEGKNCSTVGQLAPTPQEQKKFLEWQVRQPNDYYFVVCNKKGERVGLIGVYNIRDGIGEVGREVNDGTPMEAMEAEVLLEEFYRNTLKLKKIETVVYMHNKKQLSVQKKRGFEIKKIVMRNGIECAYYEMDVNEKNMKKTRELLSKIR